jgi:hypothetical protein
MVLLMYCLYAYEGFERSLKDGEIESKYSRLGVRI